MTTTVRKKNSFRKVSYCLYNNGNEVPFIRLRGQWLEEIGFKVGSTYTAEFTNKQIVITLFNEET